VGGCAAANADGLVPRACVNHGWSGSRATGAGAGGGGGGGGASVDGFASPEKFTSRSRGAGGEDEGAGGAEERASSRDEDAPPIRMSRVRLSWRGMPRGGPPKRGRAEARLRDSLWKRRCFCRHLMNPVLARGAPEFFSEQHWWITWRRDVRRRRRVRAHSTVRDDAPSLPAYRARTFTSRVRTRDRCWPVRLWRRSPPSRRLGLPSLPAPPPLDSEPPSAGPVSRSRAPGRCGVRRLAPRPS
jgi:hypothetical protein